MNAISYINKTGCQWRLHPMTIRPVADSLLLLPEVETGGHMFEDIMDSLHSLARKIMGRNGSPTWES